MAIMRWRPVTPPPRDIARPFRAGGFARALVGSRGGHVTLPKIEAVKPKEIKIDLV